MKNRRSPLLRLRSLRTRAVYVRLLDGREQSRVPRHLTPTPSLLHFGGGSQGSPLVIYSSELLLIETAIQMGRKELIVAMF